MKKSTIKLYIIELILFVSLLLNNFVMNIFRDYTLCLILGIVLFLAIILLGYEKANHRFKKDIILSLLIYTLSFYIMIYLLGLLVGFVKNGYSLNIIDIIKNISPSLVIIILSEVLRYEINTKGEKNKIILILSILLFVMIDITLQIHMYDLSVGRSVLELIAIVILPSISKNILMTYCALKFGWLQNIIYRFIMELPVYFVPILPNINLYLQSVLMLLLPMFILYRTYENYKLENNSTNKSTTSRISTIVLVVFAIICIGLTSGAFKYYTLAISSGSMSPAINKGDTIIVEKINNDKLDTLNEGDVLIYHRNKKVFVHRIIKIEYSNEKYYFKTKGDANNDKDYWTVSEGNILGKAIFRIPYLGYPTVWLNEMLNGGK